MMAALAVIASMLGDRPQQISLDVWLLLSALWLAKTAYRRLNTAAPLEEDQLIGVWGWRRRGEQPTDSRPRALVTIEGLLASSRDSDRATALRLRPRLTELSDHFLRSRHGIDPDTEPQRIAAVLGDKAWLVAEDGEHAGRTPSLKDVDELMDILLNENQAGPNG